jgi:hypothetical protein
MPNRRLQILVVTEHMGYFEVSVSGGTIAIIRSIVPEDFSNNWRDYVLVEKQSSRKFIGGGNTKSLTGMASSTYWIERK